MTQFEFNATSNFKAYLFVTNVHTSFLKMCEWKVQVINITLLLCIQNFWKEEAGNKFLDIYHTHISALVLESAILMPVLGPKSNDSIA